MLHARDDYNRIQDPAGKIPADEPVLLFRAQDELFIEVAEFYRRRHAEKYGTATQDIQDLVTQHIERARGWPTKRADL